MCSFVFPKGAFSSSKATEAAGDKICTDYSKQNQVDAKTGAIKVMINVSIDALDVC